MAPKIMLEVTQPFHKNGREVLFQPGVRFPLDADLPDGVAVRQVIVDVPGEPAPAPAQAEVRAAAPVPAVTRGKPA